MKFEIFKKEFFNIKRNNVTTGLTAVLELDVHSLIGEKLERTYINDVGNKVCLIKTMNTTWGELINGEEIEHKGKVKKVFLYKTDGTLHEQPMSVWRKRYSDEDIIKYRVSLIKNVLIVILAEAEKEGVRPYFDSLLNEPEVAAGKVNAESTGDTTTFIAAINNSDNILLKGSVPNPQKVPPPTVSEWLNEFLNPDNFKIYE